MKDCPVPGCETRIDESMLMCNFDWRAVPRSIRYRVETNKQRCLKRHDGQMDQTYHDAANAAIEAATKLVSRAAA